MQEEENTIPQMVEDVRAGKMARRQFMKRLTTMGITAAGIGAIVAASSSSAATASLQVHTADHAAKHIQLHDQHLTHQSQGNASELHNDYAEHAVVEDSMHAQPFVGHTAIMTRKNLILAAASDAAITVTNRIVHGNQVTAEWVATGRHIGDLPGLPASGRPFTLRGVTVVIRHDGKIVREALYYDLSELHRQLR
ncbi:MAG: ester cyclase [Ktedonobacteraceae bacterium]